uniref:Uncharacterized protein n=1 Tax=Hucho hucho TaxID=62062 RepID=A0A4W5P4E8_9TELE
MRRRTQSCEPGVSAQLRLLGRMYPMDPERHSHRREYGEPETCSQRMEYEEPERHSHRREYREPERRSQRMEYGEPERRSQRMEYGEPERCSQRMEYGEPERCSQRMEYGEPERCSQQMEYEEPERYSRRRVYGEPETCSERRVYGEPERCSQRMVYREPETCSQRMEYGEPERYSRRREYREPERYSRRREYREPERYSRRREYREPSSGQWNDSLKRGNAQGMAREPYSEYSSMWRTRAGGEECGASSAMSYIMDPSSRDCSKGSLRGSGAPFSPDTDGDPVELSVEDLDAARKMKKLRKITEENIACKKAVLAMQKVKRGAKDMPKTQTASATAKGMSKQRKANNTTFNSNVAVQSSRICLLLKRRVLDILSKLRRTPVRYLLRKDTPAKLKKQNKMRALELMISAPLEKEEARPLRLRVKALMNQQRYPNNEV